MVKTHSRILKASILVTIISLFGKVIGFIRDAVIAAFYGANWQTDAFFFAQGMPSIVFPAVCNSLSTAFLSAYVAKNVDDNNLADRYASKTITFSAFAAIVLSLLAIAFTPILVPLFAPGFSETQSELAKQLTRITMASFVLVMIQYMLSAVLSSKKLFYGAQIAALFYNASVIIITVVLGKDQNMFALTYTVVAGHIIQVAALCLFARKVFKYSFSLRFLDHDTATLLKLTMPIVLGNSIVQLNNIVDKVLSSLFGEGAMSALSYSNTLNRFVTGIVVTTLSTVIYPIIAEHYSKKETEDFASTIRNSISIGVIILMPISIITTFCATDIVKAVYERGSFHAEATELTAYALSFYGMMYVLSCIQEIVTRAFYSMKDTRTPLKTAAVAIVSNGIMSYVFAKLFGLGLGGIALGTTLSTMFAALLLVLALHKRIPELQLGKLKNTALKLLISSAAVIVVILILKSVFVNTRPVLKFIIVTISCFIVHFGLLFCLKCEEIKELTYYIHSVINKKQRA